MAFENIAQKLAQVTVGPSPDARAFGKIKEGALPVIEAGIAPIRQRELGEKLTGEFAADPFRLDLVAQIGRPEWVKAAGEFKKKRDEILKFEPGEPTQVPVTRKVSTEFNKDFLSGMKRGEQIRIGDIDLMRNRNGTFAFRKTGEKVWVGSSEGENENIVKNFGQQIVAEEIVPGKFVTKPVKTRGQLRKELNNIRKKLNQVIPGKSELQKIFAAMPREVFGAGAGVGDDIDKLTLEKFKAAERRVNLLASGDKGVLAELEKKSGDIPFSTIQNFFTSYLRNINNNLNKPAIEAGKFANAENSTLNALRGLNEGVVDAQIQNYRRAVNNDIQRINEGGTQAERLMRAYDLLLRVAPTAASPEKAVAAAVGDSMLLQTLSQSEINPVSDFEGGINSIPRYRVDFNSMVELALKNKKMDVSEKGENLWDDTVDSIKKSIPSVKLPGKILGFFGKGTSPENVTEIIRKNLIEDPKLGVWAPRTKEAINNPSKTQQLWMNLFHKVYGRKITINELKDINKGELPPVPVHRSINFPGGTGLPE